MKSKLRRPKVALLVPTITRTGGGVSEAVRLLHDAIVADGSWAVDVHTIAAPGFEEARQSYGDTPVHGAARCDPTRFGFSPDLVRSLLASDAEVLHVHGLWGFHCLAAYFWHIKSRRPYIVTPHGMLEHWIMRRSRAFKTLISTTYQNRLLRNASAIHALTDKERRDVEDVCPDLPISVVPNFVAAPLNFAELGAPVWWQPGFIGKMIFLFFGRIHDKKGCLELCDAWQHLCINNSGFARSGVLIFCGWIDGLDALSGRIADLADMLGNVVYAGPQFGDDKWRSLAAASFMILPSKSEGLPLAVLEAWAAGTPVIMTPECNLPEGFTAGAALSIAPNIIDIERGLTEAAALSAERRAAMSAAARGLASTTFSRREVGARMIALYEKAWLESSY